LIASIVHETKDVPSVITINQGSPTWCPQAPGRPHGPGRSPADLFQKYH